MLDAPAVPAQSRTLPTADAPLSPSQRDALLPSRPGPAWDLARQFDRLCPCLDLAPLAGLYRRRGSLPCPPLLMLQLALSRTAEGLPSPGDWADMANRDGPTRWLVLGIEPSRSACYASRDRLGEGAPLELNRQALALAQQQRLTAARAASIDGSLIGADASRHRLASAERIGRGVAAPSQDPPAAHAPPPVQEPAAEAPAQPVTERAPTPAGPGQPQAGRSRRPVRPGRTPQGRRRQQKRWRRAQEEPRKRQGRNARERKSKRAGAAKMVISPTDPQAAVGRDKRGVFRPLYDARLAADVDSDLTLGYEVLARQNDAGVLGAMLDRTRRLVGHGLSQALVGGGYVGGADLAEAEQRGVEVLGPIAAQAKTKQIAKGASVYEAEASRYVCPEGKALEQAGQSKQKRSGVESVVLKQYRSEEGACQGCRRQAECCPASKGGRTISRSEHEEKLERLKARMSQAENKKRYKRRAATVERLFGDGKEYRGMQRVRGRGLSCARTQLALMVLQHNLRVLGGAVPALAAPPPEPGNQDLAA